MYILGISCFYHESAAALIKDGKIVAASAEERFSRKKHDSGFPEASIKFCLEQTRIQASDLDYIVFYEKPFRKFERNLMESKSLHRDPVCKKPKPHLLFFLPFHYSFGPE